MKLAILISLLLLRPLLSYTEITKPFGLTEKSLMSLTFIDIDGDGDMDAFGVGTYGKATQVFMQQNQGTKDNPDFAQATYKPFDLNITSLSPPVFIDIDGDGDFDTFGSGTFGKATQIFWQKNIGSNTNPAFAEPEFNPFGLSTKSLSAPSFADIDSDGDLDAFGVGTYGKATQIFLQLNQGSKSNPTFESPNYEPFGLNTSSLSSPNFIDIDDDGDLDTFGSGTYGKATQIFFQLNTGSKREASFSPPQYEPLGLSTKSLSAPTFVDINGNGLIDAFGVGTYGKASQVFVYPDFKNNN